MDGIGLSLDYISEMIKFIYQSYHQSYLNFTGSIPEEIGSLTSLKNLKLSNNNLTGMINIICLLIRKSICNNKVVVILILLFVDLAEVCFRKSEVSYYNGSGHIPKQVGNLSSLLMLDVAFNKLTGTFTNLNALYISF